MKKKRKKLKKNPNDFDLILKDHLINDLKYFNDKYLTNTDINRYVGILISLIISNLNIFRKEFNLNKKNLEKYDYIIDDIILILETIYDYINIIIERNDSFDHYKYNNDSNRILLYIHIIIKDLESISYKNNLFRYKNYLEKISKLSEDLLVLTY